MFAEERREMILAQLKSKGRILAKDLAKEFGTSIDTIRRDLTAMEERGLLKELTEVLFLFQRLEDSQ